MTFIHDLKDATRQPQAMATLNGRETIALHSFLWPCPRVDKRQYQNAVRRVEARVREIYREQTSFLKRLLDSATAWLTWLADNIHTVVTVILTLAPMVL